MMNPEFLNRSELHQLQAERLQTTLNRACRNVSFYRQAFDRAGVDPETIREPGDLRRLPFTTGEDLAASYPYGMFAVPLKDIVRIHAAAGIAERPIAVGLTRADIQHWSQLTARQLSAAGITEHDVVQIAFRYGLSSGGLGFHYGAEAIGASVIPASSGGSVREQVIIMRDYKATALVTMPTHAAAIAAAMEGMDIHPDRLNLRIGLFGGEPWSESLREHLERRLHLVAYDTYTVAEIMGPGIAAECSCRNGLHVNEDHFILEIIDPTTLEPVKRGDEGEVVLTTIAREGFPVIRYRTRDRARLLDGVCPCGRTTARISRIAGRTDDAVFVQGRRLLPGSLREALFAAMKSHPAYCLVVDRRNGIDDVELQVDLSDVESVVDEWKTLEKFRSDVASRLADAFAISVRVTFVEAGSLKCRNDGNGAVVDKRV
jgi:phenylacetate-CoA ligase